MVQPLKVHEKIFQTKIVHLAWQRPVIFNLVDQMTFRSRFCHFLQIFSLLQTFLLGSFF